MKKNFLMLYFCTITLSLAGCMSNTEENEITIAAASSLTDVLEQAIPLYEKEYDIEVNLLLGGSGKLARQIEQGAPVDVYLSADRRWIEDLQEAGMVENDSYVEYATNRLVLVGSNTQKESLAFRKLNSLSSDKQVAIGNPKSVPAGTYTKQALEKIQVWEQLKKQVIFASNVRQVLTYVETDEVDYGIIYASDAEISDNVKILDEVDNQLHDSIIYPGIITSKSRSKEKSKAFLSFLNEKQIQGIFNSYGFMSVANRSMVE
ncbi:molybdate ABC transporter substrate-binding protein [Halobacillus sp. H74]|uniref:molybdate ABC transporter substrate-binding protein n=1 Tax=Halobacillus sp. H74 TaxID=3457436 RepID=UPI003FCDE04A